MAASRLDRQWRQPIGGGWLDERPLGRQDLGDLIAFHRRILAGLEPWRLNAETDAFFESHLSVAGCILGLFAASGTLVAYAVLGLPDVDADYNFGRLIGLPREQLGAVAHLDGVAVAPAWRGHSLQRRLLDRRIALAAAARRTWMITTVAPLNLASLHSCLSAGLTVRACRPMFASGHMRLLLALNLDGDYVPDRRACEAIPLTDAKAIAERLSGGAVGFAVGEGAHGPVLLMAPGVWETR